MGNVEIRDIVWADYDCVVDLNADVVEWTSIMSKPELQELVSLAAYSKVLVADSAVIGFLLAMTQDAPYDNQNFDWFKGRYRSFLYIDRIVIDSTHAGAGLGRAFYDDVCAFARRSTAERLVCEYSLVPCNVASQAFHQSFGFEEVGRRQLSSSEKIVSLQSKQIHPREFSDAS